jgi:succinate--hydroxymethylglutarate CoA-transferase
VVTGALNQQTWIRLCQALGCGGLCTDPRFTGIEDRVANRKALDDILNGIFSKKTTTEWVAVFDAAGLVISPVNTLADVLAHPQVAANDMMVSIGHACGPLQLVGAPMAFSAWETQPRSAPPDLGQHTDTVLASLGYTATDIDSLRTEGAI